MLVAKSLATESKTAAVSGWARCLASRLWQPRPLLSLAAVLLAIIIVARQGLGLDWREVWSRLGVANLAILALSLGVFFLTLPLRTLRWQALLQGSATPDDALLPPFRELLAIVFHSWFVNAVTIARLGDIYRAELLYRDVRADRAMTLGTIVAERLIDLAAVAATLAAAALLAFHGQVPRDVATGSIAGLAVALSGGAALASVSRWRARCERLLPSRWHEALQQLAHGFARSFARLPLVFGLSVVAWLLEGTTLFFVAIAVGTSLPFAGAIAAALVGSLLTTIPFTPSGLGFTEVGMVAALTRLGLDPVSAGAVTLMSRLITYWSLVACGAVFLIARRRARRASLAQA